MAPKAAPTHPPYAVLIKEAILALKVHRRASEPLVACVNGSGSSWSPPPPIRPVQQSPGASQMPGQQQNASCLPWEGCLNAICFCTGTDRLLARGDKQVRGRETPRIARPLEEDAELPDPQARGAGQAREGAACCEPAVGGAKPVGVCGSQRAPGSSLAPKRFSRSSSTARGPFWSMPGAGAAGVEQ